MGRWICKTLIDKKHQVYCIDDLSGGTLENIAEFKDKLYGFYKIDLSTNLNNKIEEIKPEIIYHLAANAREGASFFQPLEIVKRNLLAFTNLLESCLKVGSLDKLILFSSMAVYGDQDGKTPFDEKMERSPVDIYGINKAAMEQSTEILSKVHDFRYTILRPHNVFGIGQCLCDPYRNVIGIWMNRINRGEEIYIYGDGKQKRAFSYIEDSLPCYINAMDSKCDGEIINIGGSKPITINELADIVTKSMDASSYPVKHIPDRFGEVDDAWCTIDKSCRLLGYEENIGFEKGIEKMATWAKKRGPQEWKCEKLPLWNKKAPEWWK